jgi:hypothetical protein
MTTKLYFVIVSHETWGRGKLHFMGVKNLDLKTLYLFLGAFAKLRKATMSFVVSVCLSVRTEQLDSHWRDFDEIWYLGFFRKSVEKIQVSLKSDKNNGYFTWRRCHIYDNISLNSY